MGRETIANFGRNIVSRPETVLRPRSEDEVLHALAAHRGKRIRVVGRLHSWSEAVRCNAWLDGVIFRRDAAAVCCSDASTNVDNSLDSLHRRR